MNSEDIQQDSVYDAIRRQGAVLQDVADACRSDEDRLREIEERPRDVLSELGIDLPADMDVNVVLNTRDTFHLAMPPDPNQELGDEALMSVAGGGKGVSTAGSAGSLSSVPSTVSSVSCVGSAGSVEVGGSS